MLDLEGSVTCWGEGAAPPERSATLAWGSPDWWSWLTRYDRTPSGLFVSAPLSCAAWRLDEAEEVEEGYMVEAHDGFCWGASVREPRAWISAAREGRIVADAACVCRTSSAGALTCEGPAGCGEAMAGLDLVGWLSGRPEVGCAVRRDLGDGHDYAATCWGSLGEEAHRRFERTWGAPRLTFGETHGCLGTWYPRWRDELAEEGPCFGEGVYGQARAPSDLLEREMAEITASGALTCARTYVGSRWSWERRAEIRCWGVVAR